MNIDPKTLGRIMMALVTIILCYGFFTLHNNYKKQFSKAEAGYKDKSMLYLDKDVDIRELSDLFINGNYIFDEQDAHFIAGHIKSKLNDGAVLPNLGELNKRTFRIPASLADSLGGTGLRIRVKESYSTLGVTEEVIDMYEQLSSDSINLSSGDYTINAIVQETDASLHGIKKQIKRILGKDNKAVAGTLVRLKEHYYLTDTVNSKALYEAQDSIIAYALTNKDGLATFKGLKKEGYYSLLPVKKGFEYGASKGTSNGNLGETTKKSIFKKIKHLFKNEPDFTFLQREHRITPFDMPVYLSIKEDNALTVRTPSQFKSNLIVSLILFFITWWSFSFFLRDRSLLLPILMALSGIGLLMMYAIANPLTDKLLGYDTAIGVIIGVIVLGFISKINISRIFNVHYNSIGMQGIGYLMLALLLLALLFIFGTGPEGSGVKVNLFFFQPSEITKYLIIFFLAAFFRNNAERIQRFSQTFDWRHIKAQAKTVAVAIIGLLVLMACYLVLGDMGPALVLALTFVIIYSIVRRDLLQLLTGAITFIILLYIGYQFDKSPLTMAGFAALWLFLWLGYGLGKPKKQLFESAIFINILISVFLFGAPVMNSLGLTHQAQRLQERTDICLSGVWDNEIRGGDQVAQGLWSASSGGLTGQGLGGGNPNLTPAFHTDMIFTSIGEEMGWFGLLLIIFCMALLILRSLHIGYKSGNPFLFFLATGIAVVTGVQFLIITLGSTGLIPLTGVAVPFLSFGKTSLIINLAVFGILLSISKKKATHLQSQDFEYKQYNRMVGISIFAYCLISFVLLGFLLWAQLFARDSFLIRPAYITNQQGERVVEYNPRIQLLIKNLDAGNIYDRNGIVIATNNKDFINQQISDGKFSGVDKDIYTKELKQSKQRYYPFGDNLLFWLGDYNTKILWNNHDSDPRGYIAENRHLTALRGFDNLKYDENGNIKKGTLITKRYKGSSFLYQVEKQYEYTEYDYSAILQLLKSGINSVIVEAWNKKRDERDITLTVDAVMQTQMQNEISQYISNPELYGFYKDYFKGEAWNKLRISVVVLNAVNGDLLCSANYPLPEQDSLRHKPNYSDRNPEEKAYTDRDLGLTFQTAPGSTAKVMSALAGLQKLGVAAANKTYYIDEREVVEVGIEPRNHRVTMEEAIVKSSNNYFINLVNDQNLYPQLDSIYSAVGNRIDKEYYKERKLRSKALTPYYLIYDLPDSEYKAEITDMANRGIAKYNNYLARRNSNPLRPNYEKMNWNETAWAWGQGTLRTTPLNMARIASIVANGGNFMPTQFILKGNGSVKRPDYKSIPIVSNDEAKILKGYMEKESDKHRIWGYKFPVGLEMGGKTGTPERDWFFTTIDKDGREITGVKNMNDGWYIFFINSAKENAPLAVAVRMERLGAGISGNAVRLTDKVVLKVLKQ